MLDSTLTEPFIHEEEQYFKIAILVMCRLSGLCVFAPLLSSAAIAARIKAAFVIAMTALLSPVARAALRDTHIAFTISTIAGELGVGFLFSICLMFLVEAIECAGMLLSMEFSFSLVNLIDPNSMVETPVIGQLLSWLNWLVMIGAGLDRSLISALARSFITVPVGHALVLSKSCAGLAMMAGGIFFAGLQLAAPIVAAATVVEVVIGLVGKISPHLPVTVVSIPIKSLVSYVVLIACLAVWPHWIEGRFTALLDTAQRLIAVYG